MMLLDFFTGKHFFFLMLLIMMSEVEIHINSLITNKVGLNEVKDIRHVYQYLAIVPGKFDKQFV